MTLDLDKRIEELILKFEFRYLKAIDNSITERKCRKQFMYGAVIGMIAEIWFIYKFNGQAPAQLHFALIGSILFFSLWMFRSERSAKEAMKMSDVWSALICQAKAMRTIEQLDQFATAACYKDLKDVSSKEGIKIIKAAENILNKAIDKLPTYKPNDLRDIPGATPQV